MQQAAKSAQQGQRPQARQQGEEASRSLEPLSDQLQQRRQEMQQEWRKQVVEAIDQALSETSRLAERQLKVQEQLRERGEPTASTRAEQAAIEEGVQKVLDQVRQAGGKNALVPPQIGAALGAAQMRMQQTREAISSATPNSREAADQAGGAVDALNTAAHQLLRARGDVSGSQSGSGLAEALERLAQLAQQQGGLGQQGAGLLPMAGSGAIREQLQRLAAKQRALAQELEKLRGEGSIPGRGRHGRRGRPAFAQAGSRTVGASDGGATAAAVPPDARCRTNAPGPGGRREEGAAEHHGNRRQRPSSAGAAGPAGG